MNNVHIASSWVAYILEKNIILEIISYLVHRISSEMEHFWDLLKSSLEILLSEKCEETKSLDHRFDVFLGAMRIVLDSLYHKEWVHGTVQLQSLVLYPDASTKMHASSNTKTGGGRGLLAEALRGLSRTYIALAR